MKKSQGTAPIQISAKIRDDLKEYSVMKKKTMREVVEAALDKVLYAEKRR